MALQVSTDAQVVFFAKVFGDAHPVVGNVKSLLASGVTFEVSLYTIRAFAGKKALEPVQLTYGTTALMKGTVDSVVLSVNKKLIEDWVFYLHAKQGYPVSFPKAKTMPTPWVGETKVVLTGTTGSMLPVIKVIHQLYGGSKTLTDAKLMVDTAKAGTPVTVLVAPTYADALTVSIKIVDAGGLSHLESIGGQKITTEAKPVSNFMAQPVVKPVDAVINLKDAKALGQKVHGTSTGSVYHCIALSEHVKVAARLYKGGSISIRAEWDALNEADKKKLVESGLQMKNGYGSIHFDAADVPVQRVVGAFLVGTGIDWKSAVMNGADLVVGEQ